MLAFTLSYLRVASPIALGLLVISTVFFACSSNPDDQGEIRSLAAQFSGLVVEGRLDEARDLIVPYQASLTNEPLGIALDYIAPQVATEPDEWNVEETSGGLMLAKLEGYPAITFVFVKIDDEWLLDIGPDALSVAFLQIDPELRDQQFAGDVTKDGTGDTQLGRRSVQESPVYYGFLAGEFVYASRIVISAGEASSIDTSMFRWSVNGERVDATVEWTSQVESDDGVYEFSGDGSVFTFLVIGIDSEVEPGAELELLIDGLTARDEQTTASVSIHRTFTADNFRIPDFG